MLNIFTPYSHVYSTDAETTDFIEALLELLNETEIQFEVGTNNHLQHAPYREVSVFINSNEDDAEYTRMLNKLD